jgi:signal transduction histidine kinase
MTRRLVLAARAPLGAAVLAVLAAAQASATSHAEATGVLPAGLGNAGPLVDRPQDLAVALVLALATTAPVALLELWPLVAAGLCAAAMLLSVLAQVSPTVGGVIAVFVTFLTLGLGRRAWALAVLAAPFVVGAVVPSSVTNVARVVLVVLVVAGGAGLGWRLREDTRRRSAVVAAAHESTLEHLARGERARIARELHDVVAHHVSLIALQADAARLTVAGMPPDGQKRLVGIGDTARTALTEMRRLLGVLREDAVAEDSVTRRPQPGLAQLTLLLDEVRAATPAGARLIVRGAVAPLDTGTELTAYRIVQEALTNARRHAGGSAVDVELDYRPDRLVVRVRDVGPGPRPMDDSQLNGAIGHGLAGMKERVAMAGGTLWTGPGPVAGFVVHAELPIGGTA